MIFLTWLTKSKDHKGNYEVCLEVEGLRDRVREWAALHIELETAKTRLKEASVEVDMLRREVKVQTIKVRQFWAQKCKQLLAQELVIEEEDAEIATLQMSIHSIWGRAAVDTQSKGNSLLSEVGTLLRGCHGKAP